jgi:hypothetical protein
LSCMTVLSDAVLLLCVGTVPMAIDLASALLNFAEAHSGLQTHFGAFCQLAQMLSISAMMEISRHRAWVLIMSTVHSVMGSLGAGFSVLGSQHSEC